MARITFEFDKGTLGARGNNLRRKVRDKVESVVSIKATEGITALKVNAPWTDRTSAARNGLHTISFLGGSQMVIIYSHAVHYGIWLEVKFNGRDATVMPTILKEGPDLMNKLEGILG